MSPDAIRNVLKNPFGRPYSNDPAIEIIPSSQFFMEKGNMKDIAAVIKPPEIPDALVKAALPPHIASVPQLNYSTQQLIQVRLSNRRTLGYQATSLHAHCVTSRTWSITFPVLIFCIQITSRVCHNFSLTLPRLIRKQKPISFKCYSYDS